MKNLCLVLLGLVGSSNVFAATPYIELKGYEAAKIMSPLLDSGEQFVKESKTRHVLDVTHFACDWHSNANLDDVPQAGISRINCSKGVRINEYGTYQLGTGKRLSESHGVYNALMQAYLNKGLEFGEDCAMGRCQVVFQQIHCVVNPLAPYFDTAERMVCKLYFF